MGSASAPFKAFMESTSAVWTLQGWRDKLAAGFTHSAAPSGDKLGTLTQLAIFASQHGMVWIGLGLPPTYASVESAIDDTNRLGSHLGAMAQSRPGDGAVPESDVRTAAHLGRRVAQAAHRWSRRTPAIPLREASPRHDTTRSWVFPERARPQLADGLERTNLRELMARPARFEHHLTVCASVDDAQLEIVTASEPLFFAHKNLSDEYVVALPTGDELVDRFPLRTFLSSPETGKDVGRYNHRVGDLVLHPERFLHWPGRLRPPYESFHFAPGTRRAGLSLVYCASKATEPSWCPLPIPRGREADVKAYADPPPPMALASLRGGPGQLATIGRTSLSLIELPETIAPTHGGWVVILEASSLDGPHASCDLVRVPKGATLDGRGIVRALVLTSDSAPPDPVPLSWTEVPTAPFAPFEDDDRGTLPIALHGLVISEKDARAVTITIEGVTIEVPRYWLARMLFRVGLHGLRLGYVETYGGFFIDDLWSADERVLLGIRDEQERHLIAVARSQAIETVAQLYRAVAPPGYVERPI
jgi:hypothetical protein